MVAGSVLQRHNAFNKLLFKSSYGHAGNDATPLRSGYRLFQLSRKAFKCDAKTHLHRIIKASFPPEEPFFAFAEPTVFKHTALYTLLNRPRLNGTEPA